MPRHLHCNVLFLTSEGTCVKGPAGSALMMPKTFSKWRLRLATGAGPQEAHDVDVAGAERELVVARAGQADLGHVLPAEAAPPELQEGFENRAPELLRVGSECAYSLAS